MRRAALSVLTALGAWAAAAGTASAHPHVWIETKATLVVEAGKVTAIEVHWKFDDLFSRFVVGEFDKNKDKRFDAAEAAEVEKGAFANLKEYSYFTHPWIADKKVAVTAVRDFKPAIEDGAIIYTFVVPLAQPVDLAKQSFGISFYDETYYVDVTLAEKAPVRINGGGNCAVKVAKDEKNPIYYGMVIPQRATLSCAGS